MKDKFDVKEMGSNYWNPEIAAPVINSSVSMLDLVNESDEQQWQVDPDNLVSLIYKNKIFSKTAQELIKLNNQDTSSIYNWSIPGSIPAGDSVSNTFIYTMSLYTVSNEIVDTLVFKSGNLQFNIESDLNYDAKIEITIPGLVKNGLPFHTVMPFNYSGSIPHSVVKNLNISGYAAHFTHSGQNNMLSSTIKITVYGDSNPNNSPYFFNVESAFSNIMFNRIYGYFDQYTFNMDEDTVDIKLFDNDFVNLTIESPSVNLQFLNSFGIPGMFSFNEIKTYRDPDEVNITKLSGTPLDDILIDHPGLNQVGDVIITEKTLNQTNSNITDAFAIKPKYFIHDLEGISNPSGPTYNFALDTSVLAVNAITRLPLHGTASGFSLNDTIDFDMSEGLGEDAEMESAELQVYMKNGFPIDTKVQVYFADTNMVILDSLFSSKENILMAADPGPAPDFKVSVPVEKWTYIKKEKQSISNILDAKRAIINVEASTVNDGNSTVKIYSDYTVDIKVGVKAAIKTKF
ncbi:MAG: hypothetical protein K9H84_03225 [Bacteroidales bacterium]|nr:hypothetical protein [Bacteroidales bacterium]